MLVTATVADLHEAQPVPPGVEAHRLGIDSDRAFAQDADGQVFFMQMNGHARAFSGKRRALAWTARPRRFKIARACKGFALQRLAGASGFAPGSIMPVVRRMGF